MISVVLPVLDQIKWTDDCLKSLQNNVIQPSEVFLIDNGSKDNYQDLADSYRSVFNIRYIRNETNIGVNAAWNIGLFHSTFPYVLILNNDTCLNKFFLKKIIKVMEDKEVGICIPTREVTIPRVEMVNKDEDPSIIPAPDIEGWAFTMRKEIYNKTGPIPSLFKTFMGDTFLFESSLALGYKNLKMTNNTVYHYGSLTVKTLNNQTEMRQIHREENYEWRKMKDEILRKFRQ